MIDFVTQPPKNSDSAASGKAQPFLPFAEIELLAVRLRPAEFARAIGTTKQSVSRWIKDGKVTLGADGRLNPTKAMRELLRTGDPGRIRARLVRQAFSDMGDLRTMAARADELGLKVAALAEQIEVERFSTDQDYETLERWLDEFKRRITEAPPDVRASLDADEWRTDVIKTLSLVMDTESLVAPDEPADAELQHSEFINPRASPLEGEGNPTQ
ncbi:MAG: hypothetical protein Q7T00_01500 [Rugosibacter sp.]|nr:hypothetical protein [Rugosibacter sp.]